MFQSSKIRNKRSSLLQHKVWLFFLHGINDSDQVANITCSVTKYILWVENSCVWEFLKEKYYLADGLVLKYWLSGWGHWKKSLGVEFRQSLTAYGSGEVLLNAEIFFLCFEIVNASLLFLSVDCVNNKKVSPLGMENFSSQNIQYLSCASLKKGSWKKISNVKDMGEVMDLFHKLHLQLTNMLFSCY